MNILVIEHEPDLLERLTSILTREHYTVVTASDGKEGLEKIWDDKYDLILLDIKLPQVNGIEVITELRAAGIQTPVLMLTAKGDISDKVTGLNLGADDYLAKPFYLPELLARVRALLRRSTSVSPIIEAGHIQLNTNTRQVLNDGTPLFLTSKEFAILEFLMHHKNRIVSQFTLAEQVWGYNLDPFIISNLISVHLRSNAISVHMKNLRKKISAGGKPQLIATIRGFGYRIET